MDIYVDGFSYNLEMLNTGKEKIEETERKSKENIEKLRERIKKEGIEHFRYKKSVLTEDSKEVSLENGVIKIKPYEKCVAITVRGRSQRTINENPHKISLYLENNEGELFINEKFPLGSDRVHISTDIGYVKPSIKSGILVGNSDFQTQIRGFYQDFKSSETFYAGFAVLAGDDDMSLVITSFRGEEHIKIKKFKIYLECDRWYKRE